MKLKQLILFFVLLLGQSVGAQNDLKILVGQFPPYIDESVENQGIMTELVKEVFTGINAHYKIEFTTWSQAEEAIENKNAISFAYVKNKERMRKWYFSSPIIQAPSILIKHTDSNIELEKLSDLRKYVIGVSKNYSYGEKFDNLRPGLMIEEVNSDLLNLQKILHKRVDLFPLPLYNAIYYLRNDFNKEQRRNFEFIFSPPVNEGNLHLVCHKMNPHCIKFIELFNRGLKRAIERGVRDRILTKYLTWQD